MNTNLWPNISDAQAQSERGVRWVYLWLLISAFITVPWMLSSVWYIHGVDSMDATWSPDGKQIAFSSDRDGNWEIYVMNADGSQQTRLTNNSSWDDDPAWSPDGKRITFSSGSYNIVNKEIYVMNADGSQQTRLTNNSSWDQYPAWSPDGKRIAFYSHRDGNRGIYVMNADGSQQTRLTNNPATESEPAWSPDGKRIAFSSASEIYVMNADGSQQTRLTNNREKDQEPAWSPDGKRIAFSSASVICVMNADGSQQTRLTNYPEIASEPAWSPDGKRIAFSSHRDRKYEIYVMNADGSGVRQLTEQPLAPFLSAVLLPALVHVILVVGLVSSYPYVRRHTQQAITLVALRVLSTVLLVGLTRGAYWPIWLLMNGSLWLFGGVWGLGQVRSGDSWLMRFRGESKELPRPWAVPAPAPAVAPVTAPVSTPAPVAATVPVFSMPTDPQAAFESGQSLVSQGKRKEAIECFMFVFRNGTPDLRQRAIAELEKLGEVEKG